MPALQINNRVDETQRCISGGTGGWAALSLAEMVLLVLRDAIVSETIALLPVLILKAISAVVTGDSCAKLALSPSTQHHLVSGRLRIAYRGLATQDTAYLLIHTILLPP